MRRKEGGKKEKQKKKKERKGRKQRVESFMRVNACTAPIFQREPCAAAISLETRAVGLNGGKERKRGGSRRGEPALFAHIHTHTHDGTHTQGGAVIVSMR